MSKPAARRLFKQSSGPTGNVVLNWSGRPLNEFAVLGRSYHEAGQQLAQNFTKSQAYSDFDACPVVFLYRHALELAIKAILNLGNQLAGALGDAQLATDDLLQNHSLSRHLPKIKTILDAAGGADAFDDAGLPDAEKLINEFDAIDPGSFAFRYSVKKDGSASVKRAFAFSPAGFAEVLDPVLDKLFGICAGLEEYLHMANEYSAEMRAEGSDFYDS